MSNTFTENRDRWLQMSDIDYLGQFVKSWLAFNAWYRSAYSETRDRSIIEEIKWNPNPISARLRPMLDLESEEAEQFRTEIGLLHHRLERYEIHNGKDNQKRQIRLSNIIIRTEPPTLEQVKFRNWICQIERDHSDNVRVKITQPDGSEKFNLGDHKFNPELLESNVNFNSLSNSLKSRCRVCYLSVNPRIERDLTKGDRDIIICGTHQFRCGTDFLFAGVLEAIYLMRCSLFHGELVPTHQASDCYDPAYRIVRRFLDAVV